jgi:hypothetical protein
LVAIVVAKVFSFRVRAGAGGASYTFVAVVAVVVAAMVCDSWLREFPCPRCGERFAEYWQRRPAIRCRKCGLRRDEGDEPPSRKSLRRR